MLCFVKRLLFVVLTPVFWGGSFFSAAAQNQGGAAVYTIQPPPLAVPANRKGEVRRSVMQFDNWTLVCDEQRRLKQLVCNVTQSVHDVADAVVFSWSLAASQDGRPFMLLRTVPDADKDVPIRLQVKGGEKTVRIKYAGCDENVCLAQTVVGPFLREQIEKGADLIIAYQRKGGKKVTFEAPLSGLKEAVAAIE